MAWISLRPWGAKCARSACRPRSTPSRVTTSLLPPRRVPTWRGMTGFGILSVRWPPIRCPICIEIGLPATEYAIACYYIIATAEASSNLARYDGVRYTFRSLASDTLSDMYRNTRGEGFGAECKRRIMLGTYVLSAGYYDAYYLKAQKVRTLIARDFANAFQEVDAIVAPVSPFPAFKLGEKVDDPLAMYLSDIFTITGSLAGIPCMSVPCGNTAEGLPVGMQILTKHFDETTMFRLADGFEKVQKKE